MSKTGCVRHPQNHPLIKILLWQLEYCDGDRVAAALMSHLEYWHNIKLAGTTQARAANDVAERHGETRSQSESLWQYHTESELEAGILIFKRRSINDAIKLLKDRGVIETGTNPNPHYAFDRTRFFLFKPEVVNEWLDAHYPFGKKELPSCENAARSCENAARSCENAARSCKNAVAITETTTEITSEITTESEGQQPAPALLNSNQQLPPATATAQQLAIPKVTIKATPPLPPVAATPHLPNMEDNQTQHTDVLEAIHGKADVSPLRQAQGNTRRASKPTFKSIHVKAKLDADGYVAAGQGSNPVEIYYERFSAYQPEEKLNKPQEYDLMTLAGQAGVRPAIEAYGRTGYKPRNVALIIEWTFDPAKYAQRGKNSNGNTSSSHTNDHVQTDYNSPVSQMEPLFRDPEPGEYN